MSSASNRTSGETKFHDVKTKTPRNQLMMMCKEGHGRFGAIEAHLNTIITLRATSIKQETTSHDQEERRSNRVVRSTRVKATGFTTQERSRTHNEKMREIMCVLRAPQKVTCSNDVHAARRERSSPTCGRQPPPSHRERPQAAGLVMGG